LRALPDGRLDAPTGQLLLSEPLVAHLHIPWWRDLVMLSTSEHSKGRPVRCERIEARVSKEQKQLLVRAASLEGRSLSDFVIASAQEAARQTVRNHELLILGTQDQQAFVEALLDDAPPGARLRDAAQHYRESGES
jgi:uncharacterized protein (DUF1778 family)